eukprot:symbB.v1.2.019214.t1/scaffold1565.1/size111341/1
MAKYHYIMLALMGFLEPWPLQVLVRWRQVQQHCLRSIDLELCRGSTIFTLGCSGSGKSTLLKLLADGTPEAAAELACHEEMLAGEFFMDTSLQRPIEIIDADAIRAAMVPNDMELQEIRSWGVESSPRSARSVKWKVRMGRPLRLRFAEDIRTAATGSNFAVVAATHCFLNATSLAADVSWLRESCDEVWILDHGELRCLCPQERRDYEEIERYAALRCRMGSAALALADIAEVAGNHQDLLEVFEKLAKDEQDSVRLLAINNCIALGRIASAPEWKEQIMEVLRACAEEKSWRVRYMMADNVKALCDVFKDQAVEVIIPLYLRLLVDTEVE